MDRPRRQCAVTPVRPRCPVVWLLQHLSEVTQAAVIPMLGNFFDFSPESAHRMHERIYVHVLVMLGTATNHLFYAKMQALAASFGMRGYQFQSPQPKAYSRALNKIYRWASQETPAAKCTSGVTGLHPCPVNLCRRALVSDLSFEAFLPGFLLVAGRRSPCAATTFAGHLLAAVSTSTLSGACSCRTRSTKCSTCTES